MKRTLRAREGHTFGMDMVIAITSFLSAGFFLIDDVLLVIYLLIIPYFIFTKRKKLVYYLAVSTAISFVWMIISKNYYVNNSDYMQVIGINLYPLLAWALGLVGSYVVYTYFRNKWKVEGFRRNLSLYIVLYWSLLLFVETFGYHLLYIRNAITAIYPGLPICDCIHAPVWMQTAYFSMGPIFFLIIYMLSKFQNDIRRGMSRFSKFKEHGV